MFDGKITVSLVFSFYSAVVNLLKSIQLHFMQIQILSIWKSCTYFYFLPKLYEIFFFLKHLNVHTKMIF